MSSWKTYQVKELCSDIIDCVNKTAPISDVPTQYKMLRTSDIRNGIINTENLNCVTEDTFKIWTRRGKLKNGDIIFTREAPLGEVGLVRDAENYFLGQRLMLFRADPLVCDNRFLLYAFQYYENKQAIIAKGVGATVLHLRVPECEKIEIKAPDLSTQQRIADILSAYDDLIENNQKQIKLLEEAAQRLYKEWFVDLRFPGYEDVPVVDGVPRGWEKSHLSKIARLSAGGDKPDIFSKVKSSVCNIPVYSNGVTDDGLYGYTDSATVNDDCITISARGNVGYTCLRRTPFLPIVRLITVIPKRECVEYLFFYLKDMTFKSNGAAQQQITVPMIKDEEIVLPCNKLLGDFKEKVSPIFDLVDHLKMQKIMCEEARDRLLPKLMSGELEV